MKAASKNKFSLPSIVVGLFLGIAGVFFYESYSQKDNLSVIIQPSDAVTGQCQSIYVYIRSHPKKTDYTSLGFVETNTLTRAIEASEGKRGFGNIVKSFGSSLFSDIPFENRLIEIVT